MSEDPIAKARATLAGPLAGPAEYGRESLRVLVALYDRLPPAGSTLPAEPAPAPPAPTPEPVAASAPTPGKRRPR